MSIISLPFVGYLYLPLFLTSLIIGVVILIFFEKRKRAEAEKSYTQVKPVSNDQDRKPSADIVHRSHIEGVESNNSQNASSDKHSRDSSAEISEQTESSLVFNIQADHEKLNIDTEKTFQEKTSSCSSSEEDTAKSKSKKLRTRKKHNCSGAKTCSKKETVSQVLIVTDMEDEDLKDSLEDLTEKLKTGGLTCNTRFLYGTHQPLLRVETSQLIIFLVTSNNSCEKLQDIVLEMKEIPESSGSFIYSVACLTETIHGDVFEAAERLNVALSDLGGSEWLSLSCITQNAETDPDVVSSHQYITKILQKVKKQSKKCGTSCSSKKAADIEDLASSLLPVVTPVKT